MKAAGESSELLACAPMWWCRQCALHMMRPGGMQGGSLRAGAASSQLGHVKAWLITLAQRHGQQPAHACATVDGLHLGTFRACTICAAIALDWQAASTVLLDAQQRCTASHLDAQPRLRCPALPVAGVDHGARLVVPCVVKHHLLAVHRSGAHAHLKVLEDDAVRRGRAGAGSGQQQQQNNNNNKMMKKKKHAAA